MNPDDATFVTYRRRKGRYTEDLQFEDIQLEDTNSNMDPTGVHSDGGKGTREEEDRLEFRNSLPIPLLDRGSTSSSRKHAYTNM